MHYKALGFWLENHCQSPPLKTKMTLDNTWGPLPSTMMYWTGVPDHWEPLEALETAQYYTKME